MIESRCGLICSGCSYRQSHGCKGCVETNGVPFHGECHIAACCQGKGLAHCGECAIMPCERLYEYSYLDPEHGDKPQGARVAVCRNWAAQSGRQAWGNVLLTSAGWWRTFNIKDGVKENIRDRFLAMLGKPAAEAKVLFVPAAAIDDEARYVAGVCRDELLSAGIIDANIRSYEIDGSMCADEAMEYDAVYFTGGNTRHLQKLMSETGFDEIVRRMVSAGKVYVGVSAGSIVATPNVGDPYDKATRGLCLINAYLSVHCREDAAAREDLPLPHIPLKDNQALAVSWQGYELIED